MRHCGNCGASFELGTLVNSRCPSCGAPISSTGDLLSAADIAALDTLSLHGPHPPADPPTAPRSKGDRGDRDDGPPPAADGRVLVRVDPHNVVVLDQRTPRGTSLILTLLALAVLLLLIGVAALVGAKWSQSQSQQPVATTTGASNATVSGSPVVVTATSLATATAASGGQPSLSVAPTQISLAVCVAASAQFQVLNSGGGSLAWTANSSYNVSPASGSLAHNEQQTVTVSMISFRGSITITALGAQNSPQTVTISCTA